MTYKSKDFPMYKKFVIIIVINIVILLNCSKQDDLLLNIDDTGNIQDEFLNVIEGKIVSSSQNFLKVGLFDMTIEPVVNPGRSSANIYQDTKSFSPLAYTDVIDDSFKLKLESLDDTTELIGCLLCWADNNNNNELDVSEMEYEDNTLTSFEGTNEKWDLVYFYYRPLNNGYYKWILDAHEIKEEQLKKHNFILTDSLSKNFSFDFNKSKSNLIFNKDHQDYRCYDYTSRSYGSGYGTQKNGILIQDILTRSVKSDTVSGVCKNITYFIGYKWNWDRKELPSFSLSVDTFNVLLVNGEIISPTIPVARDYIMYHNTDFSFFYYNFGDSVYISSDKYSVKGAQDTIKSNGKWGLSQTFNKSGGNETAGNITKSFFNDKVLFYLNDYLTVDASDVQNYKLVLRSECINSIVIEYDYGKENDFEYYLNTRSNFLLR